MALEIGPIVITAGREQDFSIDGFGGGYGPAQPPSWTQSVYGEITRVTEKRLYDGKLAADANYSNRIAKMPEAYRSLITQIATDAQKATETPVEQLSIESKALKEIIDKKSVEYQAQFIIAKGFDGGDPTTGFRLRPTSSAQSVADFYNDVTAWLKAYEAGLSARLLNTEAKILNDRKSAVDAEKVDITAAMKFTADFYKEVGEKFGEKFSNLAEQLANDAKGKTIRNINEATEAFNRHKENINKKLNASDRQAIKNALDSVDMQQLASHIKTMSKGFGYAGKAIDAADLYKEIKIGFATGEWNSTLLKVETLFAGAAATGLIAFMFGVTVTAPIGILGFALIIALTGAFITDERVKNFNEAFDTALNAGLEKIK